MLSIHLNSLNHICACQWKQINHLFIALWYQHGRTDTEFLLKLIYVLLFLQARGFRTE